MRVELVVSLKLPATSKQHPIKYEIRENNY
jgi:hypothetical protein